MDNLKALSEGEQATAVYSRELDITNADHITLWLDSSKPLDASISWLACRIIEAHEIEVAKIHNIYRTGQLVPADEVKEAEARERAQIVAWLAGNTGLHPNNPALAILRAATAIERLEHKDQADG